MAIENQNKKNISPDEFMKRGKNSTSYMMIYNVRLTGVDAELGVFLPLCI
jgi:hypothetical protein